MPAILFVAIVVERVLRSGGDGGARRLLAAMLGDGNNGGDQAIVIDN